MHKRHKNRHLGHLGKHGEMDTRHISRKQSISIAGALKLEENRTAIDIDKEIALARIGL